MPAAKKKKPAKRRKAKKKHKLDRKAMARILDAAERQKLIKKDKK